MRALRWQADIIRNVFSAERMMLLGVFMLDLSLLYIPYYFISGEKFGVYSMSFLALAFAGIVCVIEARLAEKQNES